MVSTRLTLVLLCLMALLIPAGAANFPVGTRENIVIFGDSITANGEYGQIMQDLIDARYPERQIRVLSHGSHGDTVQGSFRRVEEDVVAWHPAWVIINLGINDVGGYTTDDFIYNYTMLINRLQRDTTAQIAICSPLFQEQPTVNPRMTEYVAALRQLAKKTGSRYVPLYETMKQLRPTLPATVNYTADGTHPNTVGNWMLAETILNAMDFPLSRKPIAIAVPARRANFAQSEEIAGTKFTLALPTPVQVTLTKAPLQAALCPRAKKPIVIDGKLGEWDTTTPMTLHDPDQRVWGVVKWGADRYDARAYTCYDDQAWYFAIDVDDTLVRNPANPRNVVSRDCIELCLDLRSTEEVKAEPWVKQFASPSKLHVYQYVIAPASSETPQAQLFKGNGDPNMLDGVTVASAPTPRGYVLEVRVPAKHFPGASLQPGMVVGLDFAAVNVDRQDNYLSAVEFRWSGSGSSSFSTREFGTLTLRP